MNTLTYGEDAWGFLSPRGLKGPNIAKTVNTALAWKEHWAGFVWLADQATSLPRHLPTQFAGDHPEQCGWKADSFSSSQPATPALGPAS